MGASSEATGCETTRTAAKRCSEPMDTFAWKCEEARAPQQFQYFESQTSASARGTGAITRLCACQEYFDGGSNSRRIAVAQRQEDTMQILVEAHSVHSVAIGLRGCSKRANVQRAPHKPHQAFF